MSNLKVNAKTKPLEFKRKHNELVDEMPTSEEITSLANLAIQADKNIISKIEVSYDEENEETHIIFPKYVLPLKMYEAMDIGENVYFDYGNNSIINEDKSSLGDLYCENDQVEIVISGYVELQIEDLSYCNFNNKEDLLNTYYLYFPSGGTKLYFHAVHFSTSSSFMGDTSVQLAYLSTSSEKLSSSTGVENKVPITSEIMSKLFNICGDVTGSNKKGIPVPYGSYFGMFPTVTSTRITILYYNSSNSTFGTEEYTTSHYISEFDVLEL